MFPATGYIYLVWETLGLMLGTGFFEIEVTFEDVKFLRATSISKTTDVEFVVMIQPGTGRFEISEGSSAVVTGFIKHTGKAKLANITTPIDEESCPVLPTKDFYKELRLRGYHYNGAFKSVIEAKSNGLEGKVKWDGNWVSFMDCLLQIYIVGRDTRNLLLPTGIQKMIINPKLHQEMINDSKLENPIFDVKLCKHLNKLRSGGIEICGLSASAVGRRRMAADPVLETYKFISHIPTPILSSNDAARFCVQLALENILTIKVKCVEIDSNDEREPFISSLFDALSDLPLIMSECNYLTSRELDLPRIIVEDKPLSSHSENLFIVKSNCLTDISFLTEAAEKLQNKGFLVCREECDISLESVQSLSKNYQLIAVIPTEHETIVLIQHNRKKLEVMPKIFKILNEDDNYEWIEDLKKLIKAGPLIVYAQNETDSGILGLVNCIRKEPGGSNLKCVFIDDPRTPVFDVNDPFYSSQLKLGLAINVFKNGNWGTYRHLALKPYFESKPRPGHCYANSLIRGDLSSMTWLTGPYNFVKPKGDIVSVKYASLNFRDVMLATGKLTAEVFGSGRLDQECILGKFSYEVMNEWLLISILLIIYFDHFQKIRF